MSRIEPAGYAEHVSRYTFPYLEGEEGYRFLTVENRGRQGDDRWVIFDSSHCYNPTTDHFEYEALSSERSDEWMAQTRMPLAEALPLAKRLAEEMGRLVRERIVRRQERRVALLEGQLVAGFSTAEERDEHEHTLTEERAYLEECRRELALAASSAEERGAK